MTAAHMSPLEPQWFGHPRGLTILFLTEAWEKFSYYGMRSILIYYMVRHLLMDQGRASLIYGLYTAFIFLAPLPGGWITDRWLGNRRAVIIGGLIMAAGHFMMAWEALLIPALVTIILGNGLYLPSLPSQISRLYAVDDPRRKTAYAVYYAGINLGSFLAPLVCGLLGETLGWHYGFAAAGAGMVIGLLTYVAGGRYLPAAADKPMERAAAGTMNLRRRFALLFAIAGAVMIFRGAYEQLGNGLSLWIGDRVARDAGGFTIPLAWFQSLNPLFIFLFTPVVLPLWSRMARAGREPGALAKMAIGAAIVAFSYLLIVLDTHAAGPGGAVPWPSVALFFAVLTMGELWILPVGLALFGRLAPAHLTATTIATWFFAGFAGNLLAGLLGQSLEHLGYEAFFALIAGVAGLSAILLALLIRPGARAEAAPPFPTT